MPGINYVDELNVEVQRMTGEIKVAMTYSAAASDIFPHDIKILIREKNLARRRTVS